jgi:hypothetical protein
MSNAIRRVLLVGGCGLLSAALYVGITIVRLHRRAHRQDIYVHSAAVAPCLHPIASISAPRVMSERESHPLVVHLASEGNEKCEAAVRLAAVGFEVSPPEMEQRIQLGPERPRGEVTWVIAPRQVGEYVVDVSSAFDHNFVSIVVTNILGLRARNAQLMVYLAGALGSILTVPWWLDRIKGWRSSRTKRRGARRRLRAD